MPELLDGVEDLADVGVHLRQRVGEVAVAGLAREVGVRQRREVHQREGDVGVERLAGLDAALHEVDGRGG